MKRKYTFLFRSFAVAGAYAIRTSLILLTFAITSTQFAHAQSSTSDGKMTNATVPVSGYASVEYMASATYRTVAYGSTLPNDGGKEINRRNATERAIYGHYAGFCLGLSYRLSHTFYINPFMMTQGFAVRNASLTWHTGISKSRPVNALYEFQYKGIATGYRYSGYKKLINFVFDGGIYLMKQDTIENFHANSDIEKVYGADLGKNANAFGFRLGMGFNIVPCHNFSFFCMPTANFNLTSVNSGIINTYFHNIGIMAGLTFNTIGNKGTNSLPTSKNMYKK